MKKLLMIITFLALTIGIFALDSKFYYPPLPIDSVSKKEVLQALNNSHAEIVKIADENKHQWFITRMEQGKGYDHLKQMIMQEGWQFNTQEGSGFFFKKGDRKMIATTQMWTRNYVLVKLPNGWKEGGS